MGLVTAAATAGALLAASTGVARAATPTNFFNGFETGTSGWIDSAPGTITQETASYTSGDGGYANSVAVAHGSYDARLHTNSCTVNCNSDYTRYGGYSSTFPTGGYTTSLSIYLDATWAAGHPDVRFDWVNAVTNANTGLQLRDFAFNAGTTPTGYVGKSGFVIGSSPNSTRSGAFPSNPCPDPSTGLNTCRTPVVITASGWYSFVTHFRDGGGTNGLAVDMTVLDSSNAPVASWTIFSGDAMSTVGGNRYGWFSNQEIDNLAIDDTSLRVADATGPITSNVAANPNPVALNTASTVTATVDDTTTGNSNILSAAYTLNGGPSVAMAPSDGAFDSPTENVTATIPAQTTATVNTLCVSGTDTAGNTGTATCISFVVYDPSGGFVTGGGWFTSPAGAYSTQPTATGMANFGFVSKYQKGATVPNGNTMFKFGAGALSFSSDSYQWLVVNQGGTNAQFKGTGTLNGLSGCTFMVWAGDNGTSGDSFRITIADPSGTTVYDNGAQQTLGGGSIIVHK